MTFPESYTKTLSLLPYFGEMAMVVTDGKILCLCRFNLSPRQHLQNEIKNSKANFRNKAKTNFKDLKIRQSGKTVSLAGPVDSIARFEAWQVEQQKTIGGKLVTRTFDLNTTAKRGDILATLAAQTGRKLVLQGNAAESLAPRIKIDLKKASLETLIIKCLEGTGLGHQLSDSEITVFSL